MKRMFLGKIVGLFVTAFVGVTFWNLVIFVGIGHLFDELHEHIIKYMRRKIDNKIVYQNITDEFIFLFAYWVLYLNLNAERSYYLLAREVIIEDQDNIKSLYDYYIDDYLVKNGKNALLLGKRITRALRTVNFRMEDKISFFKIIELVFDGLILNPTDEDIKKLKRVAKILNINYTRESEDFDYEYSYNNDDFSNNEEDISLKASLTEDIIKAFKTLGFSKKQIGNINLIDVKKAYKIILKEYHPDKLDFESLTLKEKEKAERKVANLNYSMDLVKKYLANS